MRLAVCSARGPARRYPSYEGAQRRTTYRALDSSHHLTIATGQKPPGRGDEACRATFIGVAARCELVSGLSDCRNASTNAAVGPTRRREGTKIMAIVDARGFR